MKRICFLLVIVVFGISLHTNAQALQPAAKVFKMTKDKYDLGQIKKNEPATFYMEFTNITKKPLIVESVLAGCGCTIPEKPSQPVMPGKTGKIKVGYNPSGDGKFSKDVTIKVKGAEPLTVYFSGESI